MTSTVTDSGPLAVIERLQEAINRHDIQAMSECFSADYESKQPVHPDRAFRGRDQMIKNWTQILGGVPDLKATHVRWAVNGDTIWSEWDWSGTRRDGVPQAMRGVTIQRVEGDLITWVHLYIEPVVKGTGIDSPVREHANGGRPE